MALDILIYREKEILGFTTIEKKSKYLAIIGLVAVSEQERGKGIASKLIESSSNYIKLVKITTILLIIYKLKKSLQGDSSIF